MKEKKYYYVSENAQLDQIEKETGRVSYRRVIEEIVGDMVLCNNLPSIDESVYENMCCEEIDNSDEIEELKNQIEELEELITETSTDEEDEETTEKIKELEEKIEALEEDEESSRVYNQDIYQWFICNLNSYDIDELHELGVITSYSNMLDCDVICVDHFGSSWRIVPCDAYITHDWELYKKSSNIWNS